MLIEFLDRVALLSVHFDDATTLKAKLESNWLIFGLFEMCIRDD